MEKIFFSVIKKDIDATKTRVKTVKWFDALLLEKKDSDVSWVKANVK